MLVVAGVLLLCTVYPMMRAFAMLPKLTPAECAGDEMIPVQRFQRQHRTPVIGILTTPNNLGPAYANMGTSVLSYRLVQLIESGGAKPVLLRYDMSETDMNRTLAHMHGVVIGGDYIEFVREDTGALTPWGRAANSVWRFTLAKHMLGARFPLWAIGSGFEFLHYAAVGSMQVLRTHYDAENMTLPLEFDLNAANERLMNIGAEMPAVASLLQAQPIAYTNIERGVLPSDYAASVALSQTFTIISTSMDIYGRRFVSTMQGANGLRVYGMQWHPEESVALFENFTSITATDPFTNALLVDPSTSPGYAIWYYAAFFAQECGRFAVCDMALASDGTVALWEPLDLSLTIPQIVISPQTGAKMTLLFFGGGATHFPAPRFIRKGSFEDRFLRLDPPHVPHFGSVMLLIAGVFALILRHAWLRNIQVSRTKGSLPASFDVRAQVHAPHLKGVGLLHELFEKTANSWAEMPALRIAGPTGVFCSYATLNTMANKIAVKLHDSVQGPNAVVAICLSRKSADFFAAVLGVLKAGGAVLVVEDPNDLEQIEQLVQITVVLSSDSFALQSSGRGPLVVNVNKVLAVDSSLPATAPALGFRPECAIVQVDCRHNTLMRFGHASLAQYVFSRCEQLMLIAGIDAVAQSGPISTAAFIDDMFAAWAAGVSVVVFQSDAAQVPEDSLVNEAVTMLRCEPGVLAKMTPRKFQLPLMRQVLIDERSGRLQRSDETRWAKLGRNLIRMPAANGGFEKGEALMPTPRPSASETALASTNSPSSSDKADTMSEAETAGSAPTAGETTGSESKPSVVYGGDMPVLNHAPHLAGVSYLHEMFQRSAAKWPSEPCLKVVGTSKVITFAQMQSLANKVSVALAKYLTAPDIIIAVNLPRDSEIAFATLLGILQAGGAALMLDKSVPPSLQEYMASAAGVKIVVGAEVPGCERLTWESVMEGPTPERFESPLWLRPEAAATVLFTSGSTGRPKGLRNPHNAYVHFHQHNTQLLQLPGKGFVTAQMAKFGFDVSIREIFVPWCVGACLCILPDSAVSSGAALPDVWAQEKIGFLCGVPSLLKAVGNVPPCVRVVYMAGEPVSAELLRSLTGQGCMVINGYGTSETPMSVCRAVHRPNDAAEAEPTIGGPVPGMCVVLLDDSLETTPMGQTGEICIGGIQLTLGYLDTAKSAVALIEHPQHGRLYRTGDLGKITPQGTLEFLGRNDDQVKIAGNRLELAGVDSALQNIWGRPALAKQLTSGQLVAYVEVPPELAQEAPRHPEHPDQPAELWALASKYSKPLLASLAKVLPPYGVPARIYAMAALPRTTVSRKVSRRMLPEPTAVLISTGADDANEVEAWVIQVAREILGDPALQLDDQLTASGGSSIAVARLAAALRSGQGAPSKAVNYGTMSVKQLLQAGSLRELAEQVQAPGSGGGSSSSAQNGETANRLTEMYCPSDEAFSGERPMGPAVFTGLQVTWSVINVVLLSYVIVANLAFVSEHGVRMVVIVMFLGYCLFAFCWSIVFKRLAVIRPGVYPMWGLTHLKMWCTDSLTQPMILLMSRLQMRSMLALYLRLLGATVGKDVAFAERFYINGYDMLEFCDNCIIGLDTVIEPICFVKGGIRAASITIGRMCDLGVCSSVAPGTVLQDKCQLLPKAAIQVPVDSPARTRWEGNPAVALPALPEELERRQALAASAFENKSVPMMYAALKTAISVAKYGAKLEVSVCLIWWHIKTCAVDIITSEWASIEFWIFFTLHIMMAALVKRAVASALLVGVCRALPKVKPGVYALNSWMGMIAKVKVDAFGALQKENASSAFASYWLAAAGAKVYPTYGNLEFGFMRGVLPDTFSIAACNSSGAKTYSTSMEVNHHCIVIRQTALTAGCFVGNGAVLGSSVYRNNLTIGVGTWTPTDSYPMREADDVTKPRIVFGNPPVEFPAKANTGSCDPTLYEPTWKNFIARVLITDVGRSIADVPWYMLPTTLAAITVKIWAYLPVEYRHAFVAIALPLIFFITFGTLALLFLGLKWMVVGRAVESTHGMWDTFVQQNFFMWRVQSWIGPIYKLFGGTLALNPYMRALGLRIGSRSLIIEPGSYLDLDLLNVGSGVVLKRPRWQIHTFEDRVLKLYETSIGDHAIISNALVVGGSSVQEGAMVLPGSCVLKGEELGRDSLYAGAPVSCVGVCPADV